MCMAISEDKIMAVMDFLVNKMGYSSTLVAKQSSILRQSLEKRIVPRALFARELLSQGLVTDFKLSVLFHTSEKVFVDRFVNKAPNLLKLYKEKLNASEKKSNVILAVFFSSIDEPLSSAFCLLYCLFECPWFEMQYCNEL
ncbi:hypothetical protein Gohar_016318 [Gossypium harknessii]|uniref:Uncharacterized protein n=1 Tax=Gossypium harknessii TaxID=34285 RepID=A0A7J9G4N8_9ROSI|nr:hypothetical protein [Gossypium harknessii]